MSKILVVLSGGLDSTTLLYHLRAQGHEVCALSVDYGQRHKRELDAARSICGARGIPHEVADLSALKPILRGSSQTDDSVAVPEGHYAAENMKLTIVPNRNMILLAVSGAAAIANGCDGIAYAAHAGDHAIYPDCRPEFAKAMATALGLCDWKPVVLLRPFVTWTKAQIAARAVELGVPIALTWSCYKGGATHCGVCGTCVERREAFRNVGATDPTIYDAHAPALDTILAKGAPQ